MSHILAILVVEGRCLFKILRIEPSLGLVFDVL